MPLSAVTNQRLLVYMTCATLGCRAKRFVGAVSLAALLFARVGLAAPQAVYPGATWLHPSPEVSGWSVEKLQAADDVARSIGTSAYVVVHRGTLVTRLVR